ncbi:MAG: hypothetical protein H0T43_04780 [Solirubrobacterales bacterium]|nr:hypothetical protein [Solirubrobacterales bacterium]
MLALAETETFWGVALGIGLVVIVVVALLMTMLLSFLKDIEASAATLLEVSGRVADNTAGIDDLGDTGPVLEMIDDEALMHDAYLERQLR